MYITILEDRHVDITVTLFHTLYNARKFAVEQAVKMGGQPGSSNWYVDTFVDSEILEILYYTCEDDCIIIQKIEFEDA